MQGEPVGVDVEVADAGEEDLAVDPEAGMYLHALRGEWIAGREDGREWRGSRDRLREDAGVVEYVLADGVVSLN